MTPRLEILPETQRRLWDELSCIPRHFVLYGGTSLALRFAHRESEDFDFFTTDQIDPETLRDEIVILKNAELIQGAPNTAGFIVDRGGAVKVSFFGGLSMGRVGEPERCDDNRVCVASTLDVAVQKLKVVQGRAAAKDYLDIAALLRNGVSLDTALGAALTLYPEFSPSVALRALTFYNDGDLSTVPHDDRAELTEAVRLVGELPTLKRANDRLECD